MGAHAETRQVCAPGGSIAATVWDYADAMELMTLFWDAAETLEPAAEALHEERRSHRFAGRGSALD